MSSGIQNGRRQILPLTSIIGQFGIGLLSSFLVAEKVDVLTRRLDSNKAFLWSNSGSTECILRYDVERPETGSTVTVYLRPEFNYLLDRGKLEEIIVRYCDFINVPIQINGAGPVNAIYAPWDKDYLDAEKELDAYATFVNRRFPDMSMDVFPVKIDTEAAGKSVQARGVLYISNLRLAGLNSTGVADIFVQKMLVKEGDSTLLPTWAKFVRGVVESPNLRPTAGRDNVNQEDPAFKAIQVALGDVIVERLAYLAENRPDKFAYINQWHHDHLKGMAMVNEEFFDRVADLLLFETNGKDNHGLLSLRQYLPKNPLLEDKRAPIYYFSHHESAAQYYRMAEEKGLTVINAGYTYDEPLLEKYGETHPEVALEKLNVLDKGIFFEDLDEQERTQFRRLEEVIGHHLTHDLQINAVVSVKRYKPQEVPAVIIETEMAKAERELEHLLNTPGIRNSYGDIFSSVRNSIRKRPLQLCLNAGCPLVQLLAVQNDSSIYSDDVQRVLTALYNNALLYSHRLDEKNRSIVHDGVTGMMFRILQMREEAARLRTEIEKQRQDAMEQTRTVHASGKPEHIRLFMMTPFADAYAPVVEAMRLVFEQGPFWFEVSTAKRDFKAATLVKNVQAHIASAHGFLAEVSEQRPNVMMEVGNVILGGDPRPIFAIKEKESPKVPADFGDLLTFSYESREVSAKSIAEEIRDQIVEDGNIINADLKKLCAARSRRYLSRTLLQKLTKIPLEDGLIQKIRARYSTVEAFVEAAEEALKEISADDEDVYLLKMVQTRLKKQAQEDGYGG